MVEGIFPEGLEPLLATLAEQFVDEGSTREVDIVSNGKATLVQSRSDPDHGDLYCICIHIPPALHKQLGKRLASYEDRLLFRTQRLLPRHVMHKLEKVSLAPALTAGRGWRKEARTWLSLTEKLAKGDTRKAPDPPASKRQAPRTAQEVDVRANLLSEARAITTRDTQRRVGTISATPAAPARTGKGTVSGDVPPVAEIHVRGKR